MTPHLAAHRQRQLAKQRQRHADHELADVLRAHRARIGDHHRGRHHLVEQHRADAGGGTVHPAQPLRRRQMEGTQLRRERDVRIADHRQQLRLGARVIERVLRELPSKTIDVGGGDVPGADRAVDGDDDLHRGALKCPDRPPLFSTR